MMKEIERILYKESSLVMTLFLENFLTALLIYLTYNDVAFEGRSHKGKKSSKAPKILTVCLMSRKISESNAVRGILFYLFIHFFFFYFNDFMFSFKNHQ